MAQLLYILIIYIIHCAYSTHYLLIQLSWIGRGIPFLNLRKGPVCYRNSSSNNYNNNYDIFYYVFHANFLFLLYEYYKHSIHHCVHCFPQTILITSSTLNALVVVLHRIGEAFNRADANIGTSDNKNNNYDNTHNDLLDQC